jgi:putative ABC transport system ATP-binding protein
MAPRLRSVENHRTERVGVPAPAPADLSAAAASVRGLSRRFGDRAVLDDLDLDIAPGEFVALIGRSGSGKSTLLNLISGIDAPDEGTVEFDGALVSAMAEPARTLFRRAHIGFIYQFFNLIPTLNVLENVRLVLELNGVRGAAARERTLAALESVGLRARADSAVDQLSGGEQQRVAIARAVVHRPRLLLADEPTGNLDPHTADHVFHALSGLIRQSGLTLVLATHNMDIAARMDRRVTIRDGKIVELA